LFLAAKVCCTDIQRAPGHIHGERTSHGATIVLGVFTCFPHIVEHPDTYAHNPFVVEEQILMNSALEVKKNASGGTTYNLIF
jgi:hypothetical protein